MEGFSAVFPQPNSHGIKELALADGSRTYILNEQNKFTLLYDLLFAYPALYRQVVRFIRENGYTHIYIRRGICDRFFIQFLKELKKNGIRIIYEIPTYPYDKEFPEGSLMIGIDRKYRSRLHKYVDRIVTPSPGYDLIFGVPAVYQPNGVIVSQMKPVTARIRQEGGTVNLIAVAGLSKWHGYDRIIEGMRIYRENGGSRRVVFHMVGGGKNNETRREYEALAEKYGLSEDVIFYGDRFGAELDKVYEKADIGVSSLGFHNLGLKVMPTLKSREYYAKGLPMICEGTMDFVPEGHEYMLSVPLDDSPIDMEQVIAFYDRLYPAGSSSGETIRALRRFSYEHSDMKKLMEPVTKM